MPCKFNINKIVYKIELQNHTEALNQSPVLTHTQRRLQNKT